MSSPLCFSSTNDLTRRIHELESRLAALNDKGLKVAELTIIGQPQAQGRPRFSTRNNRMRAFDPHKDKKCWMKLQLMEQYNKHVLTEPLSIDIIFHMPIPKSTSKKKAKLMLTNEIKHTKKPDIDNLVKAVLDSCNSIIFRDDSQIWQVNAKKMYGEELRTEINIYTAAV